MKGIIFYFDNGMEQMIPGATIKAIVEKPEKLEKNWLAYGDNYLINTKHVVEVRRTDNEEDG